MKMKKYSLKRYPLSEYLFLKGLFFILLFLFPFFTQANTVGAGKSITAGNPATAGCGCDITISPSPADGTAYLNGQTLGVKPGFKVCLKAAHYVDINLSNFFGTKAQPVTIINCGGLVTVSGYASYGFVLHNSRYVNISGAGDPGFKYGILIDGSVASTNVGFAEDGQVSDISVDHMEVSKAGLGVACAPTPNCDPASWSTNWKMYNMNFHDNYVHETLFEGFYIGNTQNYYTYTCSGSTITVQPQQIDSVRFYNNILDKCGWTSAQISQVTGGVDIHDNLITNFGFLNKPEHQAGLIVGGISRGRVYRNKILKGTGSAFQYFGAGLTTVYNNIFAQAGYDGSTQGQNAVLMDDRRKPPGFPALKIYLFNNTIISPKRSGISFYNDYGTVDVGNIIANNIITSPGLLASFPAFAYIDLQANPHVSPNNNLELATVGLAGLVNAVNNDYHLLAGSPAIDNGMNAAPYGITDDMDGNARPYGKGYDMGAYEYSGGAVTPLVANAGANQTITLPVNSETLDGSQSFDPNGTITSYGWTQLSGPSAATISNNSAVSTAVSGMIQGIYFFRLTVKDNLGATATASDTIYVNTLKVAPSVNAGSPQTIKLPVNAVNLNGVATGNNGAIIKTTVWTKLSGNTATIASPSNLATTVTGLIAGTYAFRLAATDNNGLSNTSSVSIVVNPADTFTSGTNQTIRVNLYAGVNPYSNSAWNNWNVSAATTSAVTSTPFHYADGTSSPLTATLSGAQGVADNGTSYGGTIAPPEVLRYASYNSSIRTLTLHNIPATSISSLEIYGSRANLGNSSIYTINGISKTLVTDFNLTGDAVFSNIPVSNGDLVINVDKKGSFNYINGFKITLSTNKVASITENAAVNSLTAEINSSEKFLAYPNPAVDLVNITWTSSYKGNASISLFDISGRQLQARNIIKDQQDYYDHISLSALKPGVYILVIKLQNGKSFIQKLVKG